MPFFLARTRLAAHEAGHVSHGAEGFRTSRESEDFCVETKNVILVVGSRSKNMLRRLTSFPNRGWKKHKENDLAPPSSLCVGAPPRSNLIFLASWKKRMKRRWKICKNMEKHEPMWTDSKQSLGFSSFSHQTISSPGLTLSPPQSVREGSPGCSKAKVSPQASSGPKTSVDLQDAPRAPKVAN